MHPHFSPCLKLGLNAVAFGSYLSNACGCNGIWASTYQPRETQDGSRINSYFLANSACNSADYLHSHIGDMHAKVVSINGNSGQAVAKQEETGNDLEAKLVICGADPRDSFRIYIHKTSEGTVDIIASSIL